MSAIRAHVREAWAGAAYGDAWREITYEISPLEKRIQQRPATSWTDCVELAEVAWWGIQHRGVDRYTNRAAVALTEAVLSLGGGERLYCTTSARPETTTAPVEHLAPTRAVRATRNRRPLTPC